MTTVLAGGDSFVWGSELADSPHGGPNGYSRQTFPALLADDYICVAYPGLGNQAIATRVKDYLLLNDFPDAVIVCWTWPTRDNEINSDNHIYRLQDFLEYCNIPYLFTCADNCVVSPYLDLSNWYMFPPGCGVNQTETPRGFYQWAIENKYQVGPESHPLEQAHKDASILMQEKFNEVVKKFI